ncbi:MAG: allantoinase AllB [Polyangia bacterium]
MARALRSTRIVTPDGFFDGAVVIDGDQGAEKIVDLVDRFDGAEDLGELVVMPGLVDSHAHLNEPGRTEWEGFDTATRAAAAGGVTTIVDMPLNCIPVTTSLVALREKQAAVASHAHIDYGFWGGIVPGNTHELQPMIDAGVRGFKAFLCFSGIEDFQAATEADLRAAMPILARANAPLLVHAELEDVGAGGPAGSSSFGDPHLYSSFLASRPPRWEVDAVALVTRLAAEYRCPTHIVHLSAADALADAERARAAGVPLSLETCPHYLTLEAESVPDGHTEWKCAPPIREHENRERLWEGLRRGTIELVVSDHSPCTPALKKRDTGDFEHAWGGIASLQLAFPLVWSEAKERGFSLLDLARWMSSAPAALARLPQKGRIAPGMDADLVVLDPDERYTVTPELLYFRHKLTPYMGRTVTGRVHRTLLRGTTVFSSGSFPALARGRYLG